MPDVYLPDGPPVKLGGPASYGSYAVTKRISKLDQTISLTGLKVLDLGCGNGCYTTELERRGKWTCGLDIQMSNLRAFRDPIPRVCGVAESLPFASESFDAVTMIEVLEHTERDTDALKECYRVLKTGGLLVLFVPNRLYPMESHPCHIGPIPIGYNIPFVSWLPPVLRRRICHARIYRSSQLASMARVARFQVVSVGYIFPPLDSFPLPFKRLYRNVSGWVERTPLRVFGVSIFTIFRKEGTST